MANGHGGSRPGTGRKNGETTQAKIDLIDLAKGYAKDALATLAEIAKNKKAPSASRVSAAVAILDRGYGKPTQALEHTGKDGGAIKQEITADAAFLQLASLMGGIIPGAQGGDDSQDGVATDSTA